MTNINELKKVLFEDAKKTPEGIVDLPSGSGKATIIPMKVKDQKAILKAMEKKDEHLINSAFDSILEKCVLKVDDKPFELDNLITQDKTFLLLKIRELSTGSKVKITHINPNTEEVKTDIEVDISQFPIKKFEGESEKEVKLSERVSVVLGLIRRKDEREMDLWIRKQKEKSIIDRRYAIYATLIKKVLIDTDDGRKEVALSFDDKINFIVESFHQRDIEKIEGYIKPIDFGVDMKIYFKDGDYENPQEEVNILSFFIQ